MQLKSGVLRLKIKSVEIDWFGQASFRIIGKKTVYIDPYVLPSNAAKADVILISHDHWDHCDATKIARIRKNDTIILSCASVARKIKGVELIAVGETKKVGGITVKAVPAYNVGKSFHPKNTGIGFVIDVDGTKIYHAGDTDFITEMSALAAERIDVALLPIGGKFTMDAREAADAAAVIRPRYVIPMHYGMVPGTEADATEFKALVDSKDLRIEVRLLG
ncbi:MBL fold metallo-hydrolase [Candidatus Micrarchaeota archaeon]|nr:MBL fold metallo-hydrolase [Candidatus Micrarchaeota archaeon]